MLEYIFFDTGLRDDFVAFVQSLGLVFELRDDPLGLVVAVEEENLDDALEDQLEDCYASLEKRQAELLRQEAGGYQQLAGFRVNLPDGKTAQVPMTPEMANRLLANFTLKEIQELLDTVARSVVDPHQHLCEILRSDS